MSEYWKSTPKYWCKHCSAYVKDTPFERKQHEATGRHQGQLKRFLRGIQNDHEKAEREKQRAKAEVDRLNRVVGGSDSTRSTSAPSSFQRAGASTAPQASAADRKKQVAQLVEMGVAVPDEYRAEMALAGDWQTISQRKVEEAPRPDEPLSKGVRKRKFEGQEEEEEAGETVVRRGWGSTTKRYPGQGHDDLDVLFALQPVKKQEEEEEAEKVKTTVSELGPADPPRRDNTYPVNAEPLDSKCPVKPENTEESSRFVLQQVAAEPDAPIFKKRRPRPAAT